MKVRDGAAWVLLFGTVALAVPEAAALQLDELDAREWHVKRVDIHGNEQFSAGTLRAEVLTQPRPWYTPWKAPAVFDPGTFEKDLERLRRFYESHGYFEAHIAYDLEAEALGAGDFVTAAIWIEENDRVQVRTVEAGTKGGAELPLPEALPIRPGQPFTEDDYQAGDRTLKEFFLTRGYAHVNVAREAKIDLASHRADVSYVVDTGPECTFDGSSVEGTKNVDPAIVLREREWHEGDRFSIDRVRETRENLLKRDLFSTVEIGWETRDKPSQVPMILKVEEKPPREIKFSVGFATDDHYRAQLRWQHNNWLGDGRQLGITLKYSSITSTAGVLFVQPHFLLPHMRGVIEFLQDRDDEDNYTLDASRLLPRLEPRITRDLSAYFGVRVERDKLTSIDQATVDALGGEVKSGLLLFGPSLGLRWNTTTDPLNPQGGEVVSLAVDEAGPSGDFDFYTITGEAKKYQPLVLETILAGRAKLAFATPIGAEENLPLFERLYAGGEQSVRGYGRRRLGPRDSDNNPIGGLSSVEASIELRHQIWGPLGGAIFFDAGQVSLDRFDPPVGDLKFGTGIAFTYATPVGPMRFDLGFPLERPPGDSSWQLYFSIGQFY
ncbi:MAG TPA: BamA/TamA family outer membrane protein [Candidatus Binatia bacterium]|nr:BamA/TamA family outer membrane protein [Candidatus Binatia bacterium]